MKFDNNNKEVIKKIIKGSLNKSKARNKFAVIAIILTTFMISSVFSMGLSFANNYKIMNLRLQGSTATVVLQNPSDKQIRKIKALNLCDSIGYEIDAGDVVAESMQGNRTGIRMKYSDRENFQKHITPCVSGIKGKYPEGENEIMASRKALDFLGKGGAEIGDKIEISCRINNQKINKEFILSGYYTAFDVVQDTGCFLVSEKFIDENNLTLETNGKLLMTIKEVFRETAPDILDKEVDLRENQKFSYRYDRIADFSSTLLSTVVFIAIIAFFVALSGYLLIYNILYISVCKDINFYGLLKTIGASPRQIRSIVRGQALMLAAVGIPIGLFLGAAVSLGIVPLAMGMFVLGESAMPTVVSFNPVIFIAAAVYSLLTVVLSCRKPAKIAGSISPYEALRHTGNISRKQKKSRNSSKGAKIYRMAWYNVFREKKRALVVFLSLFMGIIVFLSYNTFLGSLNVENYINRYVKNDFTLQNIQAEDNKLDNESINKIKTTEGVNTVSISKSSILELKMNDDILMPSLKETYARFGQSEDRLNEYLKMINENPSLLTVSVVGLEDNLIEKFNSESKEKIDVIAFKNGRLALLDAWYYGENYRDIKGNLTLNNSRGNTSAEFSVDAVKDENGFLPSGLPSAMGISTVYISNSALEKLDRDAVNYLVYINVDKKYEAKIEAELKNFSRKRGLWFESKSDKTEDFSKAQMVMNILGGGISVILMLIGILNFVNVMITGVNARLKELAVMESIGMTKKQIKMMLTFEGMYYAGVTTLLISTLGMGIIYVTAVLTKRIADYAVIQFPAISLTILLITIFAVCLIIPTIVFRKESKSTLTERLKEIYN